MLDEAHRRGFEPRCVAFDSWYASLPNLKKIRSFNWTWLTRLKENRQVNPDRQGLCAISQVEISSAGRVVWLEGYGLIRVFKIVITEGDIEYWATNDVQMTELARVKWAGYAWTIEKYHRGLKQLRRRGTLDGALSSCPTQSYWDGVASVLALGDSLLSSRHQLV